MTFKKPPSPTVSFRKSDKTRCSGSWPRPSQSSGRPTNAEQDNSRLRSRGPRTKLCEACRKADEKAARSLQSRGVSPTKTERQRLIATPYIWRDPATTAARLGLRLALHPEVHQRDRRARRARQVVAATGRGHRHRAQAAVARHHADGANQRLVLERRGPGRRDRAAHCGDLRALRDRRQRTGRPPVHRHRPAHPDQDGRAQEGRDRVRRRPRARHLRHHPREQDRRRHLRPLHQRPRSPGVRQHQHRRSGEAVRPHRRRDQHQHRVCPPRAQAVRPDRDHRRGCPRCQRA